MGERTLVGRDRELGVLRAEAAGADAGTATMVLVDGEAGEGKSSLVEALVSSPECDKAVVLRGACSAVGTFLPFEPFVLALNQYAVRADPAHLKRLVGDPAPALARLVPNMARALAEIPDPEPLDPRAAAERSRRGLVSVFGRLATDRLVVLVLEDLHWAGDATLGLLGDLLEASAGWRVLLLATVRRGDADRSPRASGLIDGLGEAERTTRLRLGGLDRVAVRSLAEEVAGRKISNELVDALARATEGNPLFVTEYVRHLADHGALDAGWDDLVVPATVQAVITERIGRLGEGPRRALTVAAVLGRDFSLDLWSAVSGIDDEGLAVALADGVRAGVVESVTETVHTFTHALIADGFTSGLTAVRQKRLHREAGRALEAHYGDHAEVHAAELAHHFSRGGGTVREQTVRYAALAGRQALVMGDNESSEHHFRTALDVLSELDDDNTRDASEFELRLGLIGAELTDRWITTEGAIGAAERAMASLPRILELLDGAGDSELALLGLATVATFPLLHGDIADATALFSRAVEMAEALDSPADVLMHAAHLATCGAVSGDLDLIVDAADRGAPLLSAQAVPSARYWQLDPHRMPGTHPDAIFRGCVASGLWLAGRYREADERDTECRRSIETLSPQDQAWPLLSCAMFAMMADRRVEALEAATRVIEAGSEVGVHFEVLVARMIRGRARAALGDVAGVAELEEVLGWCRLGGVLLTVPTMLRWLAESALVHRGPDEALRALEEADRVVERTGQRSEIPEIHRVRGELLAQTWASGDLSARSPALHSLQSAVDSAAGLGIVPYRQRAAASLAELLEHQGRAARAASILRAAIDLSTDGGTCPDLDTARAALQRMRTLA